MTLNELCEMVGKPYPYVRMLQGQLGLPVPKDRNGYTRAYGVFLRNVLSLRAFGVPMEDIVELLKKEVRILEILHVDSFTAGPTWYLEHCGRNGTGPSRLLLTEYDIGCPVQPHTVQPHFDFGHKSRELFTGKEMGEDAGRAVRLYLKLVERIRERVTNEEPVLRDALQWARRAFAPG
jgi:hypothetical protein